MEIQRNQNPPALRVAKMSCSRCREERPAPFYIPEFHEGYICGDCWRESGHSYSLAMDRMDELLEDAMGDDEEEVDDIQD